MNTNIEIIIKEIKDIKEKIKDLEINNNELYNKIIDLNIYHYDENDILNKLYI